MKTLIVLLIGFLAAVATLSAQDIPKPQADGPGAWKHHGKKHGRPPGMNLTPEEREKLSAAREKANEDPTVRSLREAKEKVGEQLANAMRAAMLAAEPSLGPTLDKIQEARNRAKEMKERFRSLTPEQRKQLKAARMAAKNDPAVQSAREKLRAAQGPEAKRAAAKELHQAMKAAMLKADPSLASLLEQLRPPGPSGSEDGEGPDGPMSPDMDDPPDDPTF
jgi:hypothetical protein